MAKRKPIPKFKTERAERKFWETHDSTEYIDWRSAKPAMFPNLKPTTESISIRLPAPLLNRIRLLANERDVPYQSLIKVLLRERLDQLRTGH